MNEYEATSSPETLPGRGSSGYGDCCRTDEADGSSAAALTCAAIGLSVGLATSSSAAAARPAQRRAAPSAARWRRRIRRRSVQRPVGTVRRRSGRHGRQRVGVELHLDDVGRSEGDHRRDSPPRST